MFTAVNSGERITMVVRANLPWPGAKVALPAAALVLMGDGWALRRNHSASTGVQARELRAGIQALD